VDTGERPGGIAAPLLHQCGPAEEPPALRSCEQFCVRTEDASEPCPKLLCPSDPEALGEEAGV